MESSNCNGNGEGDIGRQSRKRTLELETEDNQIQNQVAFSAGTSGDDNDGRGNGKIARTSSPAAARPIEDDDGAPNHESEEFKRKDRASKVMNNSLVMAKVAEGLPLKNLWDLRRNCTMWNQNFILQLRKKPNTVYLSPPKPKVGRTIELMQLFRSSQQTPLANYNFDAKRADKSELNCFLQDFVPTLGNIITSLSIDVDIDALPIGEKNLRKIIFELTPQLMKLKLTINTDNSDSNENEEEEEDAEDEDDTNLRQLKTLPKLCSIKLNISVDEWMGPDFTQLLYDMTQCATQLKCLDFSIIGGDHDLRNPTLGGVLQSAAVHLSNLKNLNLSNLKVPDLQNLNLLARPDNGVKLEALTIHFSHDDDDEHPQEAIRLLREFLITQSPTLKKLDLTISDWDAYDDAHRPLHLLPRMEVLNYFNLSFHYYQFLPSMMQFEGQKGSKTFADTFPVLKRFYYNNSDNGFRVREDFNRFNHNGIDHFKLIARSSEYTKFLRFGPVFANLTRLELILHDENFMRKDKANVDVHVDVKEFGKIWTTWPNLTAVELTWRSNSLDLDLDAWLTGIPRPNLENLQRDLDMSNITMDLLLSKLETYKTRPGLSSLTQLQKLGIYTFGKNSPKLTDMGGYFGLALASCHLQNVIIRGEGKNLISEECSAFIRNVFGLCTVISL